ncbi:MAG: GNAT family N-acetyltransferase [Clostridiales bacterium]|nr:GNAT family N-acetyltransferase [Clostridiales bacterium]
MEAGHREISYRELKNGEVELCRDLCNALMAHQAEKGAIHPEVLRAMTFDNRLLPNFRQAAEKQLVAAFDGERPVGYVFSTAAWQTEASKKEKPDWALGLTGVSETGLYPPWLPTPQKVGCLNNLYVLPEYRGRHIAYTLSSGAMQWFCGVENMQTIYVFISNGNDGVVSLYRNLGFRYSHDVFGGFIIAYSMQI